MWWPLPLSPSPHAQRKSLVLSAQPLPSYPSLSHASAPPVPCYPYPRCFLVLPPSSLPPVPSLCIHVPIL